MMAARSLILGSAAALLASGGAPAADLPVKATAVEPVKICSRCGVDFWFIPGTDTEPGNYLRVAATFNGGAQGQPAWNGDIGQQNRYRDYSASRSRSAFTDTRTASAYGMVRTFMQAGMQFATLGNNTFNPNSLATSLGNNAQPGRVDVHHVFIQFAGFTFASQAFSSGQQGSLSNLSG
jgi:hypothetical protein